MTKITNTDRIIIQKRTTILMTVRRDVLIVVDDNFDGVYAQVPVRSCVSVSVNMCGSLYDTRVHSKKISNDQELIQSDPTSCPQNQKGNN